MVIKRSPSPPSGSQWLLSGRVPHDSLAERAAGTPLRLTHAAGATVQTAPLGPLGPMT